MLETLDYTIRIGSTPTFLYFDLYLYSAYELQSCCLNKNIAIMHVVSNIVGPTILFIIVSRILLSNDEATWSFMAVGNRKNLY